MAATGGRTGRRPTERQRHILGCLGGGAALVTGKRREIDPMVRRGWVIGDLRDDNHGRYYAWVRITPDGLRALADALETWPWPDIGPNPPDVSVRVCAKCGSTRYRIEARPATEPLPGDVDSVAVSGDHPKEAS